MRLHFFNSAVITNSKMDYRPYPSSPGPLFQNDGRCSAFDIEIIFHSHANKTHFHKKGCAPSLILKGRVFGTRKWPITWTLENWAPMPSLVTTSLCLLLRLPWHILTGTIFWFTTGHLPPEVPQILINREPLRHMTFDVELLGDCDVIITELCQKLGGAWNNLLEGVEIPDVERRPLSRNEENATGEMHQGVNFEEIQRSEQVHTECDRTF